MSSHKEAPGITNDPAADNTDVYAFVSPDAPDTVTLIANYVPFDAPAGGPNFGQFGDDVLYEIHIDNDGDAESDITYQFRFRTVNTNPDTFLYNTGPIESLTSKNWNRRQYYTVKKIQGGKTTTLGTDLQCPPVNVGKYSTDNYAALADAAIHSLAGGGKVFAGQRAEGFYVDLGSVFDLGILRPFANAHLAKLPASGGINATKALNIFSIAIQVPKTDLTKGGYDPTSTTDKRSVIGVYASASRQQSKVYDDSDGTVSYTGNFVQLSRLANPLFNELINPMGEKDEWNASDPSSDSKFAKNVLQPELAKLLPVLYPGVFPNLAKYKKDRADLAAILLTGIPAGVISDDFTTFTGTTEADLVRLNMAVPPTVKDPSNMGLLGMDLAGFPNGRRVFDDVTNIELQAIAGGTIPLVDKSYTPDKVVKTLTEGLTSSNKDVNAKNTVNYIYKFPYLGLPHGGYSNPGDNKPAAD